MFLNVTSRIWTSPSIRKENNPITSPDKRVPAIIMIRFPILVVLIRFSIFLTFKVGHKCYKKNYIIHRKCYMIPDEFYPGLKSGSCRNHITLTENYVILKKF